MVSDSVVSFPWYRPAMVTSSPHNPVFYLSYILYRMRQTTALQLRSLVFSIFSSSGIILCTVRPRLNSLWGKDQSQRPSPAHPWSGQTEDQGSGKSVSQLRCRPALPPAEVRIKTRSPDSCHLLCITALSLTRSNSRIVSIMLFEQIPPRGAEMQVESTRHNITDLKKWNGTFLQG